MPDAQTLNEVLKSYGISNPVSGGGFNWWNLIFGLFLVLSAGMLLSMGKKKKACGRW